jgi:hypothetical protein
VPNSFIYVYSFALFPEDSKQPSGSCNFSRIDNVTLRFTFPTALTADTPAQAQPWTGQIRCYALSMNVVKITSGMVRFILLFVLFLLLFGDPLLLTGIFSLSFVCC